MATEESLGDDAARGLPDDLRRIYDSVRGPSE
jgi:hypothetical protein